MADQSQKPEPRCLKCGERVEPEQAEKSSKCPKCGGRIDKTGTFPRFKFGIDQAATHEADS